ncbi:hypothetical protein OH491_08485 [Termitidicoccus mucosus]|uniref:Glycosyl hydrolase family 32 N-terminal domain-containing protein n=1 Tax=Termitidicoccus mucosus TaxID=1184151 RepID=A0A178IF48_9BACT|nr:hypothetical protein AW736_20590 [Opitutaceae bacterium TSB47]
MNNFKILYPVILCLGLADLAAQVPLRPGTELFVDDVNIIHKENVTRRTHAGSKPAAPVLVGDQPWENRRAYMSGLVVRDADGGFRMWYGTSGRLAYATSKDGLAWEKPLFSFVDHNGAKTNALVKKSNMLSVLLDVYETDPGKRYKAIFSNGIKEGGFFAYYSADGIEWKEYPGNPVIPYGSEMGNIVRDPRTKLYHAYIRPYTPKHFPKRLAEKRLGAVSTSTDFKNWSKPRVVLAPDKIDDAWCVKKDQRTEFYAMNGFPYGNSWLGVVPLFRITQILDKTDRLQSRYDGPIEGQLITSRDGLEWRRMEVREPVIPSGKEFDVSVLDVATQPLIVGDEVWMYYTGITTTHGGPTPPKELAVCLAKWRLDGFASLDAKDKEGIVVTSAFQLARKGFLEINVDASKGRLVVEVLDAKGNLLPGYAAADAKVIASDGVRHQVGWAANDSLPADIGCMLRFRLTNAALYSYTIKPAQ